MTDVAAAGGLRLGLAPEEYEALRERAALVRSRTSDWLRLEGPDRLRFTNGLVTCDLRGLESGRGQYGFFTDAKGKVISDAAFLAGESALWIELPAGRGSSVAAHMKRFVVADQVEFEELTEWCSLLVAGPGGASRLGVEAPGADDADPWRGELRDTEDGPLLVRGERRLGVPAWVLAGPRDTVVAAGERLIAEQTPEAGPAAVAAVRVEHAVPWFGLDYGPGEGADSGNFPQETGIEEWAVSFEKGCYLGQEVVARIHFRGKVNRVLRGLILAPAAEPPSELELLLGDEAVGTCRSLAYSPKLESVIGLAVVHRKAEPGAELATVAGTCRLVELPFGAAEKG